MKRIFIILFLSCLVFTSSAHALDIVADTSSLVRLLRSQKQVSKKKTSRISALPYWTTVIRAGETYQLDPRLLLSIIKCESNFNPYAVSSVGAKGLMQLMPETAKLVGVQNCFEPIQNINGGARYLRRMLHRFDGDLYVALLAYNAGPTRVGRGDIPKESHVYATRVLAFYQKLRRSS